jgi:hypothetical protein
VHVGCDPRRSPWSEVKMTMVLSWNREVSRVW